MKRNHLILLGGAIVVAAVLVYFVAFPSTASTPVPAVAVAPPAPIVQASTTATPTTTPTPTETPQPLPPVIAKMAAAVHKTPLNRPMTEVAKNWFGCNSEDAYNTTMDLLTRNDPASAERFKGAGAACVALTAGQAIKLVDIDTNNNVALVRVTETQAMLWTDPAALSGHGQHGPDGAATKKPG